MKRLLVLLFAVCLYSNTNLQSEEFVAKRTTYEIDGSKIEVKELSGFPFFYADYYSSESIVKVKYSAEKGYFLWL